MTVGKSPFLEDLELYLECKYCGNCSTRVVISRLNFYKWYMGKMTAKDAFPHLSGKELLLLTEHMCGECDENSQDNS